MSALSPRCAADSLILHGKVTMEDGSAPWRRVAVERVCSDKPEHIADTNPKGEYTWRATANRSLANFNPLISGGMGATVSGIHTPREICTIRASVPVIVCDD